MAEKMQQEVIQLDEITILEVELLAARMRTQELEEKLAIIAVRDAREKKVVLSQEEGQLLHRLSEKYNLGTVDSFKLIDRQKRLCAITRKGVAPLPG